MEVQLDGITVTFRERLPFRAATTIQMAMATFPPGEAVMREAGILAMMSEWYIVYGVESWTLDEPVTEESIRRQLLDRPDVLDLVEAANEFYQGQVVDPLVQRGRSLSPPSQTDDSTSQTPSGSQTPTPFSPSSITTTPTDDTGPTSSPPDGAYSSSQNLELAG